MNAMQDKSMPFRFMLVTIIAFSLLLVVAGYKMLVADVYKWKASLFIEDWQAKQVPPNTESILIAEHAIANAIEYSPVKRYEHYAWLGKVYEWQFYHLDWDDVEAKPACLKAMDAYRKQAELTPSWPYAWLNLLQAKTQLRQVDEEFKFAFDQVQLRGNNHPRVVLALAKLGSQNWSYLPQKYQSKTIQVISFSASQSSSNAKQLKSHIYDDALLKSTCWYVKAKNINAYDLCT